MAVANYLTIYLVHFLRIVRWCIPVELRKAKTYVFTKALLSPLMVTYNEFYQYRESTDFEMSVSTQVCRLRGALNDLHDKIQRRITIIRDTGGSVLYVFTEAENNPKYLPAFLGIGTVNYIVRVPIELQYKDATLRLFITQHNLEPLTWRIEYV